MSYDRERKLGEFLKYLITGNCGFIGHHLTLKLLGQGHSVVGLDSFSDVLYSSKTKESRALIQLSGGVITHRLRLEDSEEFLDRAIPDVDVVINLAALAGLAPSWQYPDQYARANVASVSVLLKVLSKSPGTALVHASTSSVYGKEAAGSELSPLNPVSPYGVTKRAAEDLVTIYSQSFGLRSTILRFFSVYGPGQRSDMAYSRFIRAIMRGTTLTIYGDGRQRRSNTFVDDVVDAVIACSNTPGNPGLSRIYNVAGGQTVSVLEAIELIGELAGRKPKLEFKDRPFGDQDLTQGDATKLTNEFNWHPSTSLRDGLRKQIMATPVDIEE